MRKGAACATNIPKALEGRSAPLSFLASGFTAIPLLFSRGDRGSGESGGGSGSRDSDGSREGSSGWRAGCDGGGNGNGCGRHGRRHGHRLNDRSRLGGLDGGDTWFLFRWWRFAVALMPLSVPLAFTFLWRARVGDWIRG